jgi:hypothetical protein
MSGTAPLPMTIEQPEPGGVIVPVTATPRDRSA